MRSKITKRLAQSQLSQILVRSPLLRCHIVSKTSPSNNIHLRCFIRKICTNDHLLSCHAYIGGGIHIYKSNLLAITVASREEKNCIQIWFRIAQTDDLPFSEPCPYRYIALAQRKFILYFQYQINLLLHVCSAQSFITVVSAACSTTSSRDGTAKKYPTGKLINCGLSVAKLPIVYTYQYKVGTRDYNAIFINLIKAIQFIARRDSDGKTR